MSMRVTARGSIQCRFLRLASGDASLAVITLNGRSRTLANVLLTDLFADRDAALAEFRRRRSARGE